MQANILHSEKVCKSNNTYTYNRHIVFIGNMGNLKKSRHPPTPPVDAPTRRRLPHPAAPRLVRLNQAFRRRIAHLDLTPDQFTVMRTLLEAGAITQRQLTGLMGSDPNTVASLLERMEKAGLLERRPAKRMGGRTGCNCDPADSGDTKKRGKSPSLCKPKSWAACRNATARTLSTNWRSWRMPAGRSRRTHRGETRRREDGFAAGNPPGYSVTFDLRIADLGVLAAATEFLKTNVAFARPVLDGRGVRVVMPFHLLRLIVHVHVLDQFAVENDFDAAALAGDLVLVPLSRF